MFVRSQANEKDLPGSSRAPSFALARRLEMRKNVAEETDQSEKPPEQTAKKRPKVPLEVQEKKLSPRPSFWPIVLALTLVIAFIGVMVNPILLGVGAVLTIVAIIGWMLEKH